MNGCCTHELVALTSPRRYNGVSIFVHQTDGASPTAARRSAPEIRHFDDYGS
jgi:hypothetical protein